MAEGATRRLLEQGCAYGDSLLWRLQRRYFAERGIAAWRDGEVPHYATSNPTVANAYAEILIGLRKDLNRIGGCDGPLHICELGAGSGRFAFHFLRRLAELCEESGVALNGFRYVLTDIVPANLQFCRTHPAFAAMFESGLLDIAGFDLTRPAELVLEVGGDTLGEGALSGPLVVIANYVFDSIPQDLFHFSNGRCLKCLTSLSAEGDADELDPAELLGALQIDLDEAPFAGSAYAEPALQRLIDAYRETIADSYVLFPAPALRGLGHLSAVSRQGVVLLSADRGEHRLERLDGCGPPSLTWHGCVSLPVNYHAFTRFCEEGGGLALTPQRQHCSIDVIALLMLAEAENCHETRRAYRRCVQGFGPDDFFSVTRHARPTIPDMTVEDILAYLRLSRHDSHQFGRYLPRLAALAGGFDAATRADVREAVEAVWAHYFPLGEAPDLAHSIAALLYAMDDYPGALDYYRRSIEIYGPGSGTSYNMACCLHMLDRPDEAAAALEETLRHDPENGPALALLALCQAAA